MTIPAHPVLSCAEAKAWEARLLGDERAEWEAMQRAGAAIAREILADFQEIGGVPERARVLVLAGKGHNGGDALLAVEALLRRLPAASADVIFAFDGAPLRPLAQRAWDRLAEADLRTRVRVLRNLAGPDAFATAYDLCLDGVFGLQFRLPLDEPVAELLARVNTHPRIRMRVAVDLPSGMAEQNAETVFRADFTYAAGIVKSPVLRPENAPYVGRVRYVDLGFFPLVADDGNPASLAVPPEARAPATTIPSRILAASILEPLARLRPSQSDKRTYGHLFLVGGSLSYPGAIVLAVRAALRSGAGLVTAFVPEPLVAEYAARHPEAIWVGLPVNAGGALATAGLARIQERISRASAFAVGPGLGADPEALALVGQVVAMTTVPLVIDADALRPEILFKAIGRPFVVTPHAGELERISRVLFADGRLVPPEAVVVAKGPLTRVLRGDAVYFSLHGGPVLARGGSGDILAGLIAGLLAQAPDDPLAAACQGVVWHGRAADLLARARGQVAVEISEILEHLGRALTPSQWQNSPP